MNEKKLASTIINYSLDVKENEFVLIETGIVAKNLVKELGELDIKIKSGVINPKLGMELFFCEL